MHVDWVGGLKSTFGAWWGNTRNQLWCGGYMDGKDKTRKGGPSWGPAELMVAQTSSGLLSNVAGDWRHRDLRQDAAGG